ncbi:MAG: ATP-binding protein [Chloroflexota bacterium]
MSGLINAEHQVARLTIQAKAGFVPSVIGFVHEVLTRLGMPEADARRLELAVEAVCVNVIKHGFGPDEEGSYDVVIRRRPRQVAVAIEDRGLPFDFEKLEESGRDGPGNIFIKASADEVHFNSLGRRGKQVEIVKNLPLWDTVPENSMPPVATTPAPSDAPLELRLMRPDEGVNLARLVYRCYGYSYARDSITPRRPSRNT